MAIPTLAHETGRSNKTTAASTSYVLISGTIGSDTYQAFVPANATSSCRLVIWNHAFQENYQADLQGTGGTAWTLSLTEWFVDQGIILIAGTETGDNWGNAATRTAVTAMYNEINNALSVSKLVQYGESMGGLAALNWSCRNNVAPLVGIMTVSGVCDLSLATGWGATYTSAENPMEEAASGWAGLPIFMASSPQDTTCLESQNTNPFITHVGAAATFTHVEGTGNHLTSGNYPVASMKSWLLSVLPAPVAMYPVGASPHDKAMIDLATAGYTSGTLADRAFACLRAKGYSGTLDDMLVQAGGQHFIDLYPDFKAMGLL